MASFRGLTADQQPLEAFRAAANKEKIPQKPSTSPALHVHLFEWSQGSQSGTETSGLKSVEELETQNTSTVRVLFAPQDVPRLETVDGLVKLFKVFEVPSAFIDESLQQVSQSFAVQRNTDGTTYIWFHFLCKDIAVSENRIVHHPGNETDEKLLATQQQLHANFTWLKPGFVLKIKDAGPTPPSRTRTSSSDATLTAASARPRVELLCFGAPLALRNRLQKMVGVASCDDLLQDPYALLEIVLEEMYRVLDRTGWDVAEIFGEMEKHVLNIAPTPGRAGKELGPHHFTGLHNLARHTIYLRENCESALATLEGLQQHHNSVIGNSPAAAQTFTRQALEYRKTLFQSTQRRLASLNERMSNIIQLSFHLNTQSDSRTMQSENQSMKTIAVMTLIFTPLGTIAGIFGTEFMQVEEGAPHHITVSEDFWLMWVIAVPLTVVVLVVWRVWYREAKGRYLDTIPPRKKDEHGKDEHGYMGWKDLRRMMLKEGAIRAQKLNA